MTTPLRNRLFARLLSTKNRRQRNAGRYRHHRRRLLLESLEGRRLLAVTNFTWDGGGANDNWTTPANWEGDVAPTPSADVQLIFRGGAARTANNNDFPAGSNFFGIEFAGGIYNVTGNVVALGDGGLAAGDPSLNTVFADFSPNITFSAAGAITVLDNGFLNTNAIAMANTGLTIETDGILRIQGTISGDGDLAITSGSTGEGETHLYAGNTYTGRTLVSTLAPFGSKDLVVHHSMGLGTGDETTATGTELANNARVVLREGIAVANEKLTSTGFFATIESEGGNQWNGDISVNQIMVFGSSGNSFLVGGNISHVNPHAGSSLLFSSANNGFTVLAGSNSVVGEVSSGVPLVVTGNVTANAGSVISSTLRGTGSLLTAPGKTVTIRNTGKLSPGPDIGPGVMRTGNVKFDSGSDFDLLIDGTSDRLAVTGTVNLAADLLVSLGTTAPGVGDQFVIISNDGTDPVTGTFTGLPQDSQFEVDTTTFQISYTGGDGNDVVLYTVDPNATTPYVQFTSASQTFNESEVSQKELVVTLSAPSAVPVNVDLQIPAIGNNSAFTLPLTFQPGSTRFNLGLPIQDNNIAEADRTYVFALESPSGANVGAVPEHVVIVKDDDTATVAFDSVSQEVFEDVGQVSFTVSLGSLAGFDVTVPVTVSSTSASLGSDYTSIPTSITILAGQSSATGMIDIVNDSEREQTESLYVRLGTPSGGAQLGLNRTQKVTIRDDDPDVGFSEINYFVDEDAGLITTEVHLSAPTNKEVTVTIDLRSQRSAIRNADFESPDNFTITIPAGFTTGQASQVTILDDVKSELLEYFILSIDNPIHASVDAREGQWGYQLVRIRDNESPTLSLLMDDQSVDESTGSVPFTIELGSTIEQDLSVSLYVWGSTTATIGSDFHLPTGLVIRAGEPRVSGVLTIVDDMTPNEGSEKVILRAYAPYTNGLIYVDTSATITILDNDVDSSATPQNLVKPGAATANQSDAGATAPPQAIVQAREVGNSASGEVNSSVPVVTKSSSANQFSQRVVLPGGAFAGTTVFFDANLNGVFDLGEPTSVSRYDASVSIVIPDTFDLNNNLQLDPNEGQLIAIGGVDTATNLPLELQLAAPSGFFAVSMMSTVVANLVNDHGMTVIEAQTRLLEAFELPAVDLFALDIVELAAKGDTHAAAVFAGLAKLENSVVAVSNLVSGISGAPPILDVGNLVFADIAARIAEPGSQLDLSSAPIVKTIISSVIFDAGLTAANDIKTGASQIIAEGNQHIDAIPLQANPGYLTAIARVQTTIQGEASQRLKSVAMGQSTIAAAVQDYTATALTTRIDTAITGNVVTPLLYIDDVVRNEGDSGDVTFDFKVFLQNSPAQPVSVNWSTADDEGTSADNDYVQGSGQLTWAVGDTSPRTITVIGRGDANGEADEAFKVVLDNVTNAALRRSIGYGFLLNDDVLTHTTASDVSANRVVLGRDPEGLSFIQNDIPIQDGSFLNPLTVNISGQDNIDDALTLDFTGNTYRPDTIHFSGGGGSGFDTAEILGGEFESITQTLTNATDGQTVLKPVGDDAVTFHWAGLEPFLMNLGSVDHVTFNLPDGVTTAILEDADPTDDSQPGQLQLRSPNGHFETTIFTNPGQTLTINGGNGADTITIGDLDPVFTGTILIAATALGSDTVTTNHTGWTPAGNQLIEGTSYDVFTKGTAPNVVSLKVEYVPPPNHAPTDLGLSASTVVGNQPTGTVVGTLSTIDPDSGDTFTYSLVTGAGDTDNASFTLVGDVLKTNEIFDFETQSSYSIRIRATDSFGAFVDKQFAIQVVGSVIKLDTENIATTTLAGGWSPSDSVPGFEGANYVHTSPGSNSTATLTPNIEFAGQYEVFLKHSSHANRASNAKVSVTHEDGTFSILQNQKTGGGVFHSLGLFNFATGTAGHVVIDAAGSDGYVTADAFQFWYIGEVVPIPAADLAGPTNGQSLTATALNADGFIDVTFNSTVGLDTATVTDVDAEFTVSGSGVGTVVIDGTGVLQTGTTYRYSFTGSFVPGSVNVNFTAGSFSNLSTTGNLAEQESFTVTDGMVRITLDNTDATQVNNWGVSASTVGYVGPNYLYTIAGGAGRLVYTPTIPSAGSYEVFVNYTSGSSRASNAAYEVDSQNGTSIVRVDQRTGGGVYQSLGTFNFLAGTSGSVTLRGADADGFVVGDAVQFVRVGSTTGAPTATLADPVAGASIVVTTINGRDYVDVTFSDTSGAGLDVSTITDSQQEFTLSGPGAASVSVNGSATLVSGTTYRYATTGDFAPGAVDAVFAAGTFADSLGNANIDSIASFVVTEDLQEEVIVDNSGPGFTVNDPNSQFFNSSSVGGFVGSSYLAAPTDSTAIATWTPTLANSGQQYQVYVRYTSHELRATNATYEVTHDGGATTVFVDQTSGGGTWILLGSFMLSDGSASVKLLTEGANQYVVADAVRFVLL
ncbi:Calx-beta domain-containing protein [Novipirellula sp. SH528]|uniref:golvesin C-terminal-like domain-containing protein n=1 Tax=Novipirellula sp. SH528 TaxID=3454466 RepID=UPI003F9F4A84